MTSLSPDFQSGTIELAGNRILIDGTARTLLCASLFYFRIPREQWRERLKAVKRLGYHMIDVYAPWNFHEPEPGVYNFDGQHDLEEFLKQAAEEGLYSLVRPGPYICSEYDGGALPAWVTNDPSLRIRQNDSAFLKLVGQWYDKVVPIIARQQYTHGGSVILVQADNELDFFACQDPAGYIGTLRAMLQSRGIEVPIIACAGQGDLQGAYGYAAGVAPAYNIYPNDNSADIDEHTRYHRRVLDNLETPFIVTETNRWHRTIKREIGSGVRLAGSYLQASGWDFDFDTSTTNWGSPTNPAAFATHCYDFGGVLDSIGQEREDAAQARRLSSIIAAFGDALASSSLASDAEIASVAESVGIDDALNMKKAALGVLHLAQSECACGCGGEGACGCEDSCTCACHSACHCACAASGSCQNSEGLLLTVTNLSDTPLPLLLPAGKAVVPAGQCVMFIENLVSSPVTLLASNCEMTARSSSHLEFSVVADADVTPFVELILAGKVLSSQGVEVELNEQHVHVSGIGHVEFAVDDGTTFSLDVLSAADQAHREHEITSADDAAAPLEQVTEVAVLDEQEVLSSAQQWVSRATMVHAQQVEKFGIYRGVARYQHVSCGEELQGVSELVLNGANDIFTISVNSRSVDSSSVPATALEPESVTERAQSAHHVSATGWAANAGQAVRVSLPRQVHDGDVLCIRTQTWGHGNFDDTRLPGLHLTAGRGLGEVMSVAAHVDLSDGWLLHNPADEARAVGKGLDIDARFSPRSSLSSRSSTVWPRDVVYTRTLTSADIAGLMEPLQAALEISEIHARADVQVNNRHVGTLTPLQPIAVVGEVHVGDELEITVHQSWGEPLGSLVTLLVGHEVTNWQLEEQNLATMKAAARDVLKKPATQSSSVQGAAVQASSLPVTVEIGHPQWVRVPRETLARVSRFHNSLVRFDGDNLQITAFTEEYCLGRTVLGGIDGAQFSGGDPLLLIVPDGEGDLLLRLEATQAHGQLRALLIGGELDQHE